MLNISVHIAEELLEIMMLVDEVIKTVININFLIYYYYSKKLNNIIN